MPAAPRAGHCRDFLGLESEPAGNSEPAGPGSALLPCPAHTFFACAGCNHPFVSIQGKVEKRPEAAGAAPSPEPSAGSKVAPKVAAKEGVPKQPNGKVSSFHTFLWGRGRRTFPFGAPVPAVLSVLSCSVLSVALLPAQTLPVLSCAPRALPRESLQGGTLCSLLERFPEQSPPLSPPGSYRLNFESQAFP